MNRGSQVYKSHIIPKAVMLAESPKPPKLTRSQQRYRAYLKADTGGLFREWLKYYQRPSV